MGAIFEKRLAEITEKAIADSLAIISEELLGRYGPPDTGWLVERFSWAGGGGMPKWWGINFAWTTHPDDALRFCRRVDAQGYIDHYGLASSASPTEHAWIAPPPSKSPADTARRGPISPPETGSAEVGEGA